MSGSEVIIMGYCPTCNAPYYAQGHSREDMLRADLAAATARAERAERSRDKLRAQCSQFWGHWQDNKKRAERAERWSRRYKRMLRAYRWCSNRCYDDIKRFDKFVASEREWNAKRRQEARRD